MGEPQLRSRTVTALAAALAVSAPALPAGAQQSGGASLAGTVTDGAGQPLAGVCVEVLDAFFGFESGSTATDAAGRWQVGALPAGDYLVAFNLCETPLPGAAGEYFDDAAGIDGAQTIPVVDGQSRTGIDAALAEAARLAGTVTDEATGAPLGGICVVALDVEAFNLFRTETSGNGEYELANLRGGDHLVFFLDCTEPFTYVTEAYDDVGPDATTEPRTVTVVEGRTTSGIDAGLEQGGAIQGTVTALHTGREVPLVCVGAWRPGEVPGEFPFLLALTGFGPLDPNRPLDGSYVFGGVPVGDYLVEFNAEVCGDDGYDVEWFDDAPGPGGARTLGVSAGQTVRNVDAVLEPRPSITFACPQEVVVEDGFPDVPESNVHEFAIDCIVSFGIASGRADGTYGPARPVRRDQMATFIANSLAAVGVALPEAPRDHFPDDDGNVHEPNIDALAELGVVGGKADGTYAPAETVTRAQMATFLVNAYETATGLTLRAVGDAFTDDEGNVHETNIDKAATAGIVAGTSETTYTPTAVVRRDQMASFLARLVDRSLRDLVAELFSAQGASGHATAARFADPAAYQQTVRTASHRGGGR